MSCYVFFFSSRRRHTRCALVTGLQTCALPIWSRARGRIHDPAPPVSLRAQLAAGVKVRSRRVVIGLNWTLVEGPAGLGLAHTPARGTEGRLPLPEPGCYAGRALADLAAIGRTLLLTPVTNAPPVWRLLLETKSQKL